MKVEHLPWESLEGPIFHAKELKPRKAWVTYGCWFMCVLLIIGGLTTRYKIALIFGVLYILTLLMKKDVVVTERGVEIYYQMRIATHYDFWPWKEIFSVIREEKKEKNLWQSISAEATEISACSLQRRMQNRLWYLPERKILPRLFLMRLRPSLGRLAERNRRKSKSSFQAMDYNHLLHNSKKESLPSPAGEIQIKRKKLQ